jgi:hypothetical protein
MQDLQDPRSADYGYAGISQEGLMSRDQVPFYGNEILRGGGYEGMERLEEGYAPSAFDVASEGYTMKNEEQDFEDEMEASMG